MVHDITGHIIEYERILCGERRTIYGIGADTTQEEVRAFLRYVFVDVVGWTPEELRDRYTHEIAKKLHLTRIINKVPCPPELDCKTDLFYVAAFVFPDKNMYDSKKARVIEYYKTQYLKNAQKKAFFDPDDLENYLLNCTGYMLQQEFGGRSVPEIYAFFAGKKIDYAAVLKRYKLYTPCYESYAHCIDMIHMALPAEKRDDTLYSYWKLMIFSKENRVRFSPEEAASKKRGKKRGKKGGKK